MFVRPFSDPSSAPPQAAQSFTPAGSSPVAGERAAAALGGGVAAAVVPFVDAVVHGRLQRDDLRSAAQSGVTGVGLAVAAAHIESAATAALDRAGGALVEDVAATGLGAGGSTWTRAAAARLGGAGIAGAAVNLGLSAYQNRDGLVHGDAGAVGRVAGDLVVATGAAMTGAATGAAIGSLVPGAGTIVGAGLGFIAGYAADGLMRAGGIDRAVGSAVAREVASVEAEGLPSE